MSISSASAKELAKLGVDLEITQNAGYSSASVKDIIKIAIKTGAKVKVHAGSYSSASLKDMAKLSRECVSIKI